MGALPYIVYWSQLKARLAIMKGIHISSQPSLKQKIGIYLAVLALLVAGLSLPREASARPGKTFFGAIGSGIVAGAVLGASTLPFYDQPGTHLVNLAYGAGIGAVGFLIANALGAFDENSSEQVMNKSESELRQLAIAEQRARVLSSVHLPSVSVYTPVVSLSW